MRRAAAATHDGRATADVLLRAQRSRIRGCSARCWPARRRARSALKNAGVAQSVTNGRRISNIAESRRHDRCVSCRGLASRPRSRWRDGAGHRRPPDAPGRLPHGARARFGPPLPAHVARRTRDDVPSRRPTATGFQPSNQRLEEAGRRAAAEYAGTETEGAAGRSGSVVLRPSRDREFFRSRRPRRRRRPNLPALPVPCTFARRLGSRPRHASVANRIGSAFRA